MEQADGASGASGTCAADLTALSSKLVIVDFSEVVALLDLK